MKRFCFSILLYASPVLLPSVFSQQKYRIEIGQDPLKVLPKSFIYAYEQFQDGHLAYALGENTYNYPFNFDLLNGKLMCIKTSGDTIATDDLSVQFVIMGNDKYYHDLKKGYYKILYESKQMMLLAKEELQVKVVSKVNSGYGEQDASVTTNAIDTYASTVSKYFTAERKINYWIMRLPGQITGADKKGFYKAFRSKDKSISAYLKDNIVNFEVDKDLKKLFEFCIQG